VCAQQNNVFRKPLPVAALACHRLAVNHRAGNCSKLKGRALPTAADTRAYRELLPAWAYRPLIAIGKAEQRVEKALTELRAAGRKE
jgi:hypothetical protein